jgi:hypothetical protein
MVDGSATATSGSSVGIWGVAAPAEATPRPSTPSTRAVDVLCKLINNLAVSASAADCQSASEKFVCGYLALSRVLLALAHCFPEVPTYAAARLQHFLASPAHRTKNPSTGCPDLGELLVLRLVVPEEVAPWTVFGEAFFQECGVRNVRWYAEGLRSMPRGAKKADGIFSEVQVSRRVVSFQIRFLHLCKQCSFSGFVDGAPPKELLAALKAAHQQVAALKDWHQYRALLGLPPLDNEGLYTLLEENEAASAAKGYH